MRSKLIQVLTMLKYLVVGGWDFFKSSSNDVEAQFPLNITGTWALNPILHHFSFFVVCPKWNKLEKCVCCFTAKKKKKEARQLPPSTFPSLPWQSSSAFQLLSVCPAPYDLLIHTTETFSSFLQPARMGFAQASNWFKSPSPSEVQWEPCF